MTTAPDTDRRTPAQWASWLRLLERCGHAGDREAQAEYRAMWERIANPRGPEDTAVQIGWRLHREQGRPHRRRQVALMRGRAALARCASRARSLVMPRTRSRSRGAGRPAVRRRASARAPASGDEPAQSDSDEPPACARPCRALRRALSDREGVVPLAHV